jgi:hypothetical protein
MGHRTYLGAGVATIDNGRVVDAATVIPITDPRHLLHWRHDPQRYSLENQGFKALVDWIVDHGPVPQPVMFRRRGLLTSEEPELGYIRKVYPDAAQQHPEQPRLELVYGNRRWHALIEARRIWAERGDESKTRSKARMLAVYAQLDDKDMEDAFVRENSQRAKTSIYEDQLTVREALLRNETWQEIAKLLSQPEKELRRLHEPLTEAHLAVVAAFSAGTLNRSRARRASTKRRAASRPRSPRRRRCSISPRRWPPNRLSFCCPTSRPSSIRRAPRAGRTSRARRMGRN